MASVWLLPLVVFFLGFFVVGGTVWFVIWINRASKKIDIPPNAPIIDCTTRVKFTEGYSHGLVKRELPRKNGCVLIEMYPFDMEQGEGKPFPKLQSFVVAKDMIKRFSRGTISSRREVIKVLARNPTDIPEDMRDTDEGKWMRKQGQLGHILQTFGEAIPAGDEAIFEAMTMFARGNISRATLSQMKEENQEMRRLGYKPQQEDVTEKK